MVNLTNIVKKWLCLTLMVPAFTFAANEAAINRAIPILEKKIQQTMKAQGIPGVAVAVVSRNKVYYLKTFGVKRVGKEDKITPSTLFQIASLSKPVNATMVAVLQEKGKLSVEDPVAHYLPHFKTPNRKHLKIAHLLSHSSGIPNNGFNELIESYAPRSKIFARLQRTHSLAPPGKRFVYNNAMYGMVGDIVSDVAGKPLSVTLKEQLFQPLGMKHASVGFQAMVNAKDKAYPHVPNGRGRYMPAPGFSRGYYAFPAAGGVNASVQDMIPFVQLYLGKPSSIVSKQSLRQFTSPFVKNASPVIATEARKGLVHNSYYGFGWHNTYYGHKKLIYHTGHLKGFRNFVGFIPDDVGIIVLTNADRRHASKLALSFFNAYLGV